MDRFGEYCGMAIIAAVTMLIILMIVWVAAQLVKGIVQ